MKEWCLSSSGANKKCYHFESRRHQSIRDKPNIQWQDDTINQKYENGIKWQRQRRKIKIKITNKIYNTKRKQRKIIKVCNTKEKINKIKKAFNLNWTTFLFYVFSFCITYSIFFSFDYFFSILFVVSSFHWLFALCLIGWCLLISYWLLASTFALSLSFLFSFVSAFKVGAWLVHLLMKGTVKKHGALHIYMMFQKFFNYICILIRFN